jgi:hypothetical protein
MTKNIFKKGNIVCLVEKDIYESFEKFNERGWFIVNQVIKSNLNYNEIVRLSKIWANIKYDGCVYNSSLMNRISELEKNI